MSERTDELTARVQQQTGERYTHELLAIKQRNGHVSKGDAETAARIATLNRKDRRRALRQARKERS